MHRVPGLIMLAVVAALAGCGGQSGDGGNGPTLGVKDATTSLRASHWQVSSVKGMPHTITGAPQAGYLQTTSPSGVAIDLQFFATAAQARSESVAAQAKLAGFHATSIGNAIAFSRGSGRRRLDGKALDGLRAALR